MKEAGALVSEWSHYLTLVLNYAVDGSIGTQPGSNFRRYGGCDLAMDLPYLATDIKMGHSPEDRIQHFQEFFPISP